MEELPLKVELRVAELKRTYPELQILRGPDLNDKDLFFILRSLTLGEFMHVTDLQERSEIAAQQFVVESVLLDCWSTTRERFIGKTDMPAGYVLEIYDMIQSTTKFMDPGHLALGLNKYRSEQQFVFPAAQALIMKAFPQYKLEDVEALTHEQLCRLIVLAEFAEGTPFDITPPEDQQKQEKKLLKGIGKEAEANDRINESFLNFGKENAELQAQ